MSDASNARHDLLPDVTAFVEIDGRGVESSLGGQSIRREFGSPEGNALLDTKLLDFVGSHLS